MASDSSRASWHPAAAVTPGKTDAYELLGLAGAESRSEEQAATVEDIRKGYRKSALRWHPDKCQDPEAEAMFKAVAEAYEVLSDPQKRSVYDAQGWSGLEPARAAPQPSHAQRQTATLFAAAGGSGGRDVGGAGGLFDGPGSYSSQGVVFLDPFELFRQFFAEPGNHVASGASMMGGGGGYGGYGGGGGGGGMMGPGLAGGFAVTENQRRQQAQQRAGGGGADGSLFGGFQGGGGGGGGMIVPRQRVCCRAAGWRGQRRGRWPECWRLQAGERVCAATVAVRSAKTQLKHAGFQEFESTRYGCWFVKKQCSGRKNNVVDNHPDNHLN